MSEKSPVGQDSNFSRLLGIRILRAENGEAELRMAMQEQMLNLHGRMHGGALYSLIDTALGQASHSLFGGEAGSMTLECKVNYMRPVSEGELTCHAKVLHDGTRTQVIEAEALQEGKLVAKAVATFAKL